MNNQTNESKKNLLANNAQLIERNWNLNKTFYDQKKYK